MLYGVTLRDELVTAWTLVGLALVLGRLLACIPPAHRCRAASSVVPAALRSGSR